MAHNDTSGKEVNGNSTSSDSSSTYCKITSPQKPVLRDNQTNAPAVPDSFYHSKALLGDRGEYIDTGHTTNPNKCWWTTNAPAVPDSFYHSKALLGDRGEYIDTGHTTNPNKCWWTTIDPAVQMHIPRPYIYYPNTVFFGDSGSYGKIDSTRVTDKTDTQNGNKQWENNQGSTIDGESFNEMGLPKKSFTESRRIKALVFAVFVCLSVIAAVVVTIVKKNIDEPDPIPVTPDFLTDKCNNQESVVSPGDRICIPYDDLHNTSRISHITMQQTSSTYFYTFFQFNLSVNSTVSNFTRHVDDWIVDYNISSNDQMLRLVQPKAYCSSPGKYSVILEYTDAFHTSFEFEVRMKDPQLNQSITFDDQGIHVHCELTGTCLPSSLAIYVTVNNSTVLAPGTNACSSTDKKTGTMVSIQATIPSSMFTKNQRISCVPLMRNQELAENLTNTIPICHGPECKPNCQDDSATNVYYPDYVYCDKYYQCSNGEAIEKPCPIRTYWEPMNCTCAHDSTAICDINTHKRITPLRILNPCG